MQERTSPRSIKVDSYACAHTTEVSFVEDRKDEELHQVALAYDLTPVISCRSERKTKRFILKKIRFPFFLPVYTNVSQLFSDLHANEIDGAFMERYRAAYHLSKTTNLDTLKVFQSYDEKVVYNLVTTAPNISQKGCFRRMLERIDTDTILLQCLESVRVSHKLKEE